MSSGNIARTGRAKNLKIESFFFQTLSAKVNNLFEFIV